ncbi:POK9 protein, partial [Orthonyx spaldingii]|nr:POK9 protein [Orthonyx spaldingii]
GSAGVDLAVAESRVIKDHKVHLIPSTCSGPLDRGLSALLIGRSSMSKQGIFVLPGLIDADFTGTIQIMVHALNPPVTIPSGSKIAQLIPFKSQVPRAWSLDRGDAGFGSTGQPIVAFTEVMNTERPLRKVNIQGPNGVTLNNIPMMLDTGSEITII